jgi:hypothetical protein
MLHVTISKDGDMRKGIRMFDSFHSIDVTRCE